MAKKKNKGGFDFTEQMEADAQAPEIGDSGLAEVASLAKQQLELEAVLEALEEGVKVAKDNLKAIQEDLLPQTMMGLGLSDFTMDTGEKVTVKGDIHISIAAANAAKAMAWLKKNKAGDLIKQEVVVSFGRGESKEATALKKQLKKDGSMYKDSIGVHSQTLKAFARENEAKAEDDKTKLLFPEEIFSIWASTKSQIKRVKAKAKK